MKEFWFKHIVRPGKLFSDFFFFYQFITPNIRLPILWQRIWAYLYSNLKLLGDILSHKCRGNTQSVLDKFLEFLFKVPFSFLTL